MKKLIHEIKVIRLTLLCGREFIIKTRVDVPIKDWIVLTWATFAANEFHSDELTVRVSTIARVQHHYLTDAEHEEEMMKNET